MARHGSFDAFPGLDKAAEVEMLAPTAEKVVGRKIVVASVVR